MEGEVKGKTYKMKGHTLPGINQRSEGNTDLADGRSKSSAFQQGFGAHMGAAQALRQRRNPITPGGGGAGGGGGQSSWLGGIGNIAGAFLSKPSVAKIYAAKGKRKPNPGKY